MRIPFAVLCGIAFVLLAFQPAPARMTVADCLLRSGYSRDVPDTPITSLAGVEAWGGRQRGTGAEGRGAGGQRVALRYRRGTPPRVVLRLRRFGICFRVQSTG